MGDPPQPFISVIIPTRERAETLKYAIASALRQEADSFEVIVSDNFSQDKTKEVVQSFNDSRVKYFNTGRRVSMCDSYEFAISQAAGRYTVIIGDDDAVMPGALHRLKTVMDATPCPIYAWPKGVYVWPFTGRPAAIERIPPLAPPREIDLGKLARRCVLQGLWGYTRLPNAYHSAVEKRLLDQIRESTGRVFHSTQPDLFTGFALPAFARKAINLGFPVTFHGRSPKSNAAVAVDHEGLANIQRYVGEFGDYAIHRTLFPEITVRANILPDSLLVAMDSFPQFYGNMKFNYEGMWTLFCLNKDFRFGVSAWETIRRARDIRRYHPFSISRFLGYLAAYKLFLTGRALLQKPTLIGPFKREVPDNILDFVKQLDEWQSSQRTS